MSRLFPHTPYAEDQPLARTILTTHVLYRGFQAGTFGGLLLSSSRSLVTVARTGSPPAGWLPALVRSAGYGSLVGTGLLAVALPLRMVGRTEIEWKDRSWRLLENEGQVQVDDWSLGGAGVGAVAVGLLREKGVRGGWKRVLGGVGIGSLAGVVGCLGWRVLGLGKGEGEG